MLNGTGYDPSGFNGVSLEIKNPLINSVTITDNSTTLSAFTTPAAVAPFLGNYFNPPNTQGSTETCTGMFADPSGNFINNAPYYNDLVFGGSIY